MIELRTLSPIPLFIDFVVMMWNFHMAPGEFYGRFKNLYKVTKTCLLPAIFSIWIQFTPAVDLRIVLFYLFQWIGDVILLIQGDFPTMLGGVSFLIGHVFMIRFYDIDFKKIPMLSYMLGVPPAVIMYSFVFPHMKWKKIKDYACLVYVSVLQCAAFSAVTRLCKYSITDTTFLFEWIGYLFFTASDTFLIFNEFNIVEKPLRIPIMSTYSIAQTLIMIGLISASKDIVDINSYFY